MSDITNVDIRRLDFMLLLVLREGVRQRKLTDVAKTLGVTQAAISHAVSRLRDILGDELFLRRPHGVEPTARAVELAGIADGILRDAGRLLADPAPFEPRTARRRFTIATLDYESALLASLVGRLTTEGPGLDVFFRPHARAEAMRALDEGRVDLAIGFRSPVAAAYRSQPLFEETYTTIVRAGHPRIGATLDLDAFCAEGHVVAAPGGTAVSLVARTLGGLGRSARIAVRTGGFLPALAVVGATDLIATVPSRLAALQADNFGLVRHAPPLALRPFTVAATWHVRADADPAIRWLLGEVQATFV